MFNERLSFCGKNVVKVFRVQTLLYITKLMLSTTEHLADQLVIKGNVKSNNH